MNAIMWIILAIIIALAIVMVFVIKKRKGKFGTDYKSLFWMGVIFIIVHFLGRLFLKWDSYIFLILGLIYFIMGLSNRKYWDKKVTWKDFSKKERKVRMWVILSLLIALVVLILVLFLVG